MPQNPFLQWYRLPPFDQFKPEDAAKAVDYVETVVAEALNAVDNTPPTTFDALMTILDPAEDILDRVGTVISHLSSVGGPVWQKVTQSQMPRLTNLEHSLLVHRGSYLARRKLVDAENGSQLTEAQRRLLTLKLDQAELSGVGLEGHKRERFAEMQERLSLLETTFGRNVTVEQGQRHVRIDDPDLVVGLADSLKESAATLARRVDAPNATTEAGPWYFGVDWGTLIKVTSTSPNRRLREAVRREAARLGSGKDTDNRTVLVEILALRQAQSELLGSESYAQLRAANRMSGSVAAIEEMLGKLEVASREPAVAQLEAVQQLAKSKGAPEADSLAAWDTSYWREKLRNQETGFDSEGMRSYLPLDRVLAELFDLVNELYGVCIEWADGDASVWHPDVRFCRVTDAAKGHLLGHLYLDLHLRPGEKGDGAWVLQLVPRSTRLAADQDTYRAPVVTLAINAPPKEEGKPSLLSPWEVASLFHEMGHATHALVSEVDERLISEIGSVDWEAIELPSQLLESWALSRPVLNRMARHHETGAPLPEEMINRLEEAQRFQKAG